ncbi:hypothetical protein PQ669_28340, partial [Escherichia coli]|uniref:hypothetical protein n=1 Tax=Escherichia coli TaxID=562 RepID=UPI003B99ACB0
WEGWAILLRQKQKKLIMLPSETMIWQPEFTDKTLSRKPGAVQFGSLPDTIRDEWIEDIETMGEKMDEYINAQKQANGFDLRYTDTMSPSEKDWRDCSIVLSRRDFTELMTSGWSESK